MTKPRAKAAAPDPDETPDATADSPRNVETQITKRQFCEFFGVSEAQLERHFQKGMPHVKHSSRKVLVPMPAGRIWFLDYIREQERKKAQPTSLGEARIRREMAQATLEEMRVAKEQGATMRVEEHEKLLGDAFARVRAKLLNLAPRAAGAAFGATTLQECQAKIEPVVTEIFEELALADDVPDSIDSGALPT